MSGATITDLENWVKEMMKNKGCDNYNLDISGATEKGDGYLGEVNFIKVIAKDGGGKEKLYDLVVKSAKKGDVFRKETPIREAYNREMFMYTKVFPIYLEFQKHSNIDPIFEKFPKCYSTCNENNREALILKNKKPSGYVIHDRTRPQNFEHVRYVFECYAQFHAISIALKRKRTSTFDSLTKNMTNVMGKFIKMAGMERKLREDFEDVMEILRGCSKGEVAGKLRGIAEEIEGILMNFQEENLEFSCILHGDCWNNNMMFKYQENDKSEPIDMCFIDFQLSRLGSPIYDLSYYLYTVADKPTLDRFDDLLKTYHDNLIKHLSKFKITEEIVTLKELKIYWKEHGKYGLVLAPFIVKIELCQTDEVVDIAECAENGQLKDAFNIQIKDRHIYEDRIVQVMEHFAKEFC